MEYRIADKTGMVFAANIKESNIEKTLISRSRSNDDVFLIVARLPISFNAKVLRNLDKPETIEIECNGKTTHLLRDTADQKGDVGVSCNPKGDTAAVDTFNIHFRGYEDDFTDRGIVWVCPGNPASIQLVIKHKALRRSGKVQEIIKKANSALAEKLLSKL